MYLLVHERPLVGETPASGTAESEHARLHRKGADKQHLQFSLLPAPQEPRVPASTVITSLSTCTQSGQACYSTRFLQLQTYRDHRVGWP